MIAKINRVSAQLWFTGICFSLISSTYKLRALASKEAKLRKVGASEKESERREAMRAVKTQRGAVRYQLIQDSLDICLPAGSLNFHSLDDGALGLIGSVWRSFPLYSIIHVFCPQFRFLAHGTPNSGRQGFGHQVRRRYDRCGAILFFVTDRISTRESRISSLSVARDESRNLDRSAQKSKRACRFAFYHITRKRCARATRNGHWESSGVVGVIVEAKLRRASPERSGFIDTLAVRSSLPALPLRNTDAKHPRSEGPQPHLINIQFSKKQSIAVSFPSNRSICTQAHSGLSQRIEIFADVGKDDSYTPQRLSIRAGTYHGDLLEVRLVDMIAPTGWQSFLLGGDGEGEGSVYALTRSELRVDGCATGNRFERICCRSLSSRIISTERIRTCGVSRSSRPSSQSALLCILPLFSVKLVLTAFPSPRIVDGMIPFTSAPFQQHETIR